MTQKQYLLDSINNTIKAFGLSGKLKKQVKGSETTYYIANGNELKPFLKTVNSNLFHVEILSKLDLSVNKIEVSSSLPFDTSFESNMKRMTISTFNTSLCREILSIICQFGDNYFKSLEIPKMKNYFEGVLK